MKFTKYKGIPFIAFLVLSTILMVFFCVCFLEKDGKIDFNILLYMGVSIVVYFFSLLVFYISDLLNPKNISFLLPLIWFINSIFHIKPIISQIVSLERESGVPKDTVGILLAIATFTASFYWLFVRPKEKQAEENKKSAEDKKIEENKLAEENKKLESAKKSEIKMKRHLLFFIPVFVLCPLSNFLLQNEMFSVFQLMILTAGQYVGYFLSTLFFFINKKFSSPQRLKQHIVTTFVIGTIGMIWVLSDNFFRQSAGIGFFIAVLCSALSWYTKDLKGISIINKK